jgi:hypothetical protein
MTLNGRRVAASLVSIALGTCLGSVCLSQEPQHDGSRERVVLPEGHWLSSDGGVKRLKEQRDEAVSLATKVLHARAQGAYNDEDDEPIRAARLLWTFRSANAEAIAALCDNISLHTKIADTPPLGGYCAAQALVAIGGRPATDGVFRSMRQPSSRQELLLKTFVLMGIESRETLLQRVVTEIKACQSMKTDEDRRRDTQLKNLQQIEKWLNDKDFGGVKDWPKNNQAPERKCWICRQNRAWK